MNVRSQISTTLLIAAALLFTFYSARAGWDTPHADVGNTGFTKTMTAPAVRPMRLVPVGELSTGVGPVIAPNGTVYVGNLFGQVLAFHPDGRPAWSQQVPEGQWVTASPIIGKDGSVYVISETRHPIPGSANFFYESTLNKFTRNGDPVFQVAFPQHRGLFADSRGDANAAPNMWRANGQEVVLALALYDDTWRLIAFGSGGQLLGDIVVKQPEGGTITVTRESCHGLDLYFFCIPLGFKVPSDNTCKDFTVCLPDDTGGPQPGIAVWQPPQGGNPVVMATDALLDTVEYNFDPARGFTEIFRVHDTRRVAASAPTALPDGHIAVGTTNAVQGVGRIALTGLNVSPLADFTANGMFGVDALPTRLVDGRLVVIERRGEMRMFAFQGNQSTSLSHLSGQSVAPAAASCNHFYVASAGAFTTFEIRTLKAVASVPWVGGGRSPPAIGPQGHVYAVAADALFVFPPGAFTSFAGTACDTRTNR